jgi:hypothetical protein
MGGGIFEAMNFFTRLDALFAEEYHTGRFQSSPFSFQPDLAAPRRDLDDGLDQAVERGAMIGLIGFVTARTAVAHANQLGRAGELERDFVLRHRHHAACASRIATFTIAGPYNHTDSVDHRGGYLPVGTGWYRKHFLAPGELRVTATAENLNRATVNLRVIRAGETGKTLFPSADD